MKLINLISFLCIFLITFFQVVKAQCNCEEFLGVHCGDRVKESILSGNCKKDTIYYCSAKSVAAQVKTICNFCYRGEKLGLDICSPLEVIRGKCLKIYPIDFEIFLFVSFL
jgi:hypothetical protein